MLWSSLEGQWLKDLVLSLQQLGSLLWCGFHLWPGNFHILQAQPKKKKEEISGVPLTHSLFLHFKANALFHGNTPK